MARRKLQSASWGDVWRLAAKQHGVVARAQLLELGVTPRAIQHRLDRRRLHLVRRCVYAIGHPQLTRHGRWMAAVLACGPDAVLSDASAAALWGISRKRSTEGVRIEVTVQPGRFRRQPGIQVHRRKLSSPDVLRRDGIPLTSPSQTLIHLAVRLTPTALAAMVNETDKLGLIDAEALRASLGRFSGQGGVGRLRSLLEKQTFTLTDSELERRFLPLVRRAGLPSPLTGKRVNGFKVDFYWPDLRLVVETDGLRYHRTPSQQGRDRLRDQVHAASGMTTLRFTHAQVVYEADHVVRTLAAVASQGAAIGPIAARGTL
jgi:very-short-patch-repair endonuclease